MGVFFAEFSHLSSKNSNEKIQNHASKSFLKLTQKSAKQKLLKSNLRLFRAILSCFLIIKKYRFLKKIIPKIL